MGSWDKNVLVSYEKALSHRFKMQGEHSGVTILNLLPFFCQQQSDNWRDFNELQRIFPHPISHFSLGHFKFPFPLLHLF